MLFPLADELQSITFCLSAKVSGLLYGRTSDFLTAALLEASEHWNVVCFFWFLVINREIICHCGKIVV